MHPIVSAGADITEVEHMTNVELGNLSFESAISGGMTGFMASLNVSCLLFPSSCDTCFVGRVFEEGAKERAAKYW